MLFYRFRLELLERIPFACTVTALPSQRILPRQSNTLELHLCELSKNKFLVTMHLPGQPVESEEQDPVKTICVSVKTKPGCYELFQLEKSQTPVQIMKKEHFMLPSVLYVNGEFSARICFLFNLLLERYKAGTEDMDSLVKIMRLMNYLSWNDLISGGFSSYYVTAACEYIRKNFKQKITIGVIADEIGITPNYLSRLFRETTGKTVKEALDIARASSARAELCDHDKPLRLIAAQNGFSNEKSMNQIFLKLFHMTPQKCRLFDQNKVQAPWEAEAGMMELIFQ